MRHVNIYTATTFKGVKIQNGDIGYILEFITDKAPVTLTKYEYIEGVTPNAAELKAVIKALKRMTEKCELTIYTESMYVASGYNSGWVNAWKTNYWKTSRGKEVSNKSDWQQLDRLLDGHKFTFFAQKQHSYRQWLTDTVNKAKERNDV